MVSLQDTLQPFNASQGGFEALSQDYEWHRDNYTPSLPSECQELFCYKDRRTTTLEQLQLLQLECTASIA